MKGCLIPLEPAYFLLTLLFAGVFGYIGKRAGLPAGAMIGAMAGTVLLNLTVGQSYFYAELRPVLQILSGTMIGCKISRKDVADLKKLVLPTLFLIVMIVVFDFVFGGLIYLVSDLDIATSLFAAAPGGTADMVLVSADLGANTSYVALLHLFRLLTIFLVMPACIRRALGLKRGETLSGAPAGGKAVPKSVGAMAAGHGGNLGKLGLTFLLAALGGYLLHYLGIAGGALTGAMLFSGAFSVWKGPTPFPARLKFVMQALAGAFIGIGIDRERLAALPALLLPGGVMLLGVFLFTFSMAYLMRKWFRLDPAVALLVSTPGGVQEMSLLAEDLGADTPKVALMQTARIITVILLFPSLLAGVTEIIGE